MGISSGISRRKAKISLTCIGIKIRKNSSLAQLIELIRYAHSKSRTNARGQLAGGPIAIPHTCSRTPLQLTK